jgi:tRNA-2-methylthio-N6-dimethylallyladenosine synthase
MKYFIETYGCQMNVHDSERMAGLLEASGYEPAHADADADLVVINTCSVREKAEDKLYTRLGHIKGMGRATGHSPLVAVAGCVAQQEGSRLLERSSLIDIVVGTQRLKMLPMLVSEARQRREATNHAGRELAAIVDIETPYDEPSFPLGLTRHADAHKAYVTIIEGCNDFCAFCVVPYTRGHERMRRKAEILADVRDAVSRGRSEI